MRFDEKKFYQSRMIQFFAAVLATGGLDIIDHLLREEAIGWRSVALAIVGLVGIALRLDTSKKIVR